MANGGLATVSKSTLNIPYLVCFVLMVKTLKKLSIVYV